MNVRQGVLNLFSIKNIFLDKMDLRLILMWRFKGFDENIKAR